MMSWHWTISTSRHFQNGRHNTAQIQHCPISTPFHVGRLWCPELIPDIEKFQNGHHNTAQIQHCPISKTFHMWVAYDVPKWFLKSKKFYRSPFSKWPPQYRTNSTLFDFNVLNWSPTSKNFYRSPFSKWPPQYCKNSTLFDFKGSFWFIF